MATKRGLPDSVREEIADLKNQLERQTESNKNAALLITRLNEKITNLQGFYDEKLKKNLGLEREVEQLKTNLKEAFEDRNAYHGQVVEYQKDSLALKKELEIIRSELKKALDDLTANKLIKKSQDEEVIRLKGKIEGLLDAIEVLKN